MLTSFYALSQHEAHGTSLAAIGATAVAGMIVYGLHGHVAWLTAALMAVTSVIGARLGARLAAKVSGPGLTRAFAVFMVLVALRLLWKVPAPATQALLPGAWGVLATLALGALVGLLAGFLGVGGGIIAVPALTLLFGMGQQTAQGTSLALILVTAPIGAIEHHRHGNVVTRLVPMLLVGAALGAPLASLFAQRLPQGVLSRGFALFLLASAVQMLWRSYRGKPRTSR